jgi:hypothetical protein
MDFHSSSRCEPGNKDMGAKAKGTASPMTIKSEAVEHFV